MGDTYLTGVAVLKQMAVAFVADIVGDGVAAQKPPHKPGQSLSATAQENVEPLCRLLRSHDWSVQETIIIGDRANLDDELPMAYDDHNLR